LQDSCELVVAGQLLNLTHFPECPSTQRFYELSLRAGKSNPLRGADLPCSTSACIADVKVRKGSWLVDGSRAE
jgi:hypothetical protein